VEKPLLRYPGATLEITEPGIFIERMWRSLNRRDYPEAIRWAERVVLGEPDWVQLARKENAAKAQEIGDIVAYAWGRTSADNENPVHYLIWKYPMLNEVGAAMAGAAIAHFRLYRTALKTGESREADLHRAAVKAWLRRMILEVPLHQIAASVYNPATRKYDLITGYWNFIASWLYRPEMVQFGDEANPLVVEVIRELQEQGAPVTLPTMTGAQVPEEIYSSG
jgi:hypothetical protein